MLFGELDLDVAAGFVLAADRPVPAGAGEIAAGQVRVPHALLMVAIEPVVGVARRGFVNLLRRRLGSSSAFFAAAGIFGFGASGDGRAAPGRFGQFRLRLLRAAFQHARPARLRGARAASRTSRSYSLPSRRNASGTRQPCGIGAEHVLERVGRARCRGRRSGRFRRRSAVRGDRRRCLRECRRPPRGRPRRSKRPRPSDA